MRINNQQFRFVIICLCFFFFHSISSQNLVRNSGFEHHHEFPHGMSPFKWGAINYLTDWASMNGMVDLCDTLLENRTDTFKRTSCCGNNIKPHTGKGMLKLGYSESCYNGLNPLDTGCTSYAKTKLSSPLVVGDIYEISMWVYFPSYWVPDSTIYTSIGMYLSLYPIEENTVRMYSTEYFFGDTIHTDQWVEVKQYIRALCPLKHLTIGAFRTEEFPKLHRWIDNLAVYFIDDVKVIEVAEDEVPHDILPTPFCNYFERKKKEEDIVEVDQLNLFYSTNEFALDEENKKRLDKFYSSKEGNKGRAFVITGHTDNEGNENLKLSIDRANVVRDYLKSKFNLEDHLLICYGQGEDTLGHNATEKGKQLNRRVTVQNSNITELQALYRKGLEYAKNKQIADAAKTFKTWINLAPRDQKMQILHDPRLSPVKKLAVWKYLRDEVKKDYRFYSKPWDAFFLDSMYFVDQRYRTFTPSHLTGYINRLDTFAFSKREREMPVSEFYRFDSLTFEVLKKYLANHSFPKISQVGRRQAKAASYMLAHQLDSNALKKYLPIVELYCLEGEAEWEFYAIMCDKLQVLKDQPQLYGTQYTVTDKKITGLYKLDDLEKVNIRRRRIGLSPVILHYYP